MLRITWRFVLLFICGYLVIEWFPVEQPIVLEDILIQPIINPLEFFAASIAFFVGLIISVQLLRGVILEVLIALKRKHFGSKPLFFAAFGLMVTYFFLFQIGWIHTLLLFSFSFLYGMISIEIKN